MQSIDVYLFNFATVLLVNKALFNEQFSYFWIIFRAMLAAIFR